MANALSLFFCLELAIEESLPWAAPTHYSIHHISQIIIEGFVRISVVQQLFLKQGIDIGLAQALLFEITDKPGQALLWLGAAKCRVNATHVLWI